MIRLYILLSCILFSGLLAACEDDVVAVYSFDYGCNRQGTEQVLCQPCNATGMVRNATPVTFIDSATGAEVNLIVTSKPTTIETKSKKPRDQNQICQYLASSVASATNILNVQGNAHEGGFTVRWQGSKTFVPRDSLKAQRVFFPPLIDSMDVIDCTPKTGTTLRTVWMAAELGLLKLSFIDTDGKRKTLTKKYGY